MLAVTGIGMVSPLGLDVISSCAAARAGICRIVEIDDLIVNDAEGAEIAPVSVSRVPLVSAGFFGFARLLQLGVAGLADLVRATGPLSDSKVGFILVVGGETYRSAWLSRARKDPEMAAGGDLDAFQASIATSEARIVTQLLPALLRRAGLAVVEKACKTLCAATAVGFIGALQQAEEWLDKRVCDRCVIGGLDSLLDPTTIDVLNRLHILKTPENPVGLIPGEAACFLLVENPRAAARGAAVQATLESPASTLGAAHPRLQDPAAGHDALAVAISESFARLSDVGRATGMVVVNLNGDAYRAAGWGESFVRVLTPMRLGTLPTWLPPIFFGDTGAATGPVSVALLARGWARGYASSPNALVCLMDDLGGRGTFYVRAKA